MWIRFTERARRCVFAAEKEAAGFGTRLVAPEHLLLALIRDEDSVASRLLTSLGVPAEQLYTAVEAAAHGHVLEQAKGENAELSPASKRTIDLAFRQMQLLNDKHIGTEHLLLGILAQKESRAGRVLHDLGVDLQSTQNAIAALKTAS